MSLRLKLVLMVVGLTTGLLGGLGLTLAGSVSNWTTEVADGELSRRAEALIHEAKYDDGKLELDDDDDLATLGFPFRIEAPDGTVLAGAGAWPDAQRGGLGFSTAQSRSGEPLRVLAVLFTPEHGREKLVLRVAAPLTALSGLADRFRAGLLLALVLAAVLSAAGAALLAQWFLAPLLRVTRSVDALEARTLSARVETTGLGPELQRLAVAFNGLLGRVAEVIEGQRNFVARASHALRTPLASILAQSEVALRRDRTVESYREALQSIAASTRDAAQLTDGLLALTRADASAGRALPEDVDLPQLAEELQRLFGPRAEVAGLRLELVAPAGLVLHATRAHVRELLDALLDNALRYTPRGGLVRFEAKREGPAIVLAVSDTGPGIPADERAHVFERFVRGRAAAASAQPGSGLGLSVVKALADAEGAVVALTDAPEGGTRVTVAFAPVPEV